MLIINYEMYKINELGGGKIFMISRNPYILFLRVQNLYLNINTFF